MTIRTRFAPSPTGYLHIGGARTALFSYLFARKNQGKFILRIEDTDAVRSSAEAIGAILDGMRWLGLDWDEGPFLQSERFDAYRAHAQTLLKRGLAYCCWCSPEELDEKRKAAMEKGLPPKYDGRCRTRADRPDGPFAVRFSVPPGATSFDDMIKGTMAFNHGEIEDLVILRSDNTPTYNLCVVVDDATMDITHVIRGDDHIANTPKQILLYRALGYPVPAFAHLPMILGADKARLSKRHGATSVTAYRDSGYLPHALVNYRARLGWSYGDQEIFTKEELIAKFSLESVGKSPGIFNPEKLLWLNHHYIKESEATELAPLLMAHLNALGVDASNDARVPAIIGTLKERAKTLKEMAEGALFYFRDEITFDEKAARKFLTPEAAGVFAVLSERLGSIGPFDEKAIEEAFGSVVSEKGVKLGALAQPVRVALTGGTVSPGIFETIAAMGKEKTLKRLAEAIKVSSRHDFSIEKK
ncbi:MAG: glutamate--tRNA ligase [Deltaproteobacteria bacterium]|nr:glutamate--tRNA ligase [Deltaproteobacteria bacterium]